MADGAEDHDATRLWQRAARVFDESLEVPRDGLAAFVDQACGGDQELLGVVERLLRSDRIRDGFLDRGPLTEMEDAVSIRMTERWIGKVLGSYRITEPLGQGGMGQVFLAERADREFSKKVAIKILASAMATPETLGRFRRERQILATLEHPNIARLLDGGTTTEGLPYLVMEHVVGEPIVSFCDRRRDDLRQRIRLFLGVCRAVSDAHRVLVVHRDLKPDNILVTGDGVPKLLDFGIAKLLDESEVDPGADSSATVVRALTPGYASPEQILGDRIATASDVYSLGVLLHELMTGCLPYPRSDSSAVEILAKLREHQPPLPSSRFRDEPPTEDDFDRGAAAQARGAKAEALARRLAGDLDNIIVKAIQPQPERRYDSVRGLSEDLERHLEGRPVRARPDSLVYRAGKFVRRNAVVVVAAAALALLAVVAAFRIVREREVARAEQRRAESVTGFLVESFRLADPQWSSGETVTVREALDSAAQRLHTDLLDDPELRATMMHTIGTVYANLNLYDQAEPHLAGALEIRRRIFGPDARTAAESLEAWARMKLRQGDLDESRRAAGEAHAIRRRHGGAGQAASLRLQAELDIERGEREIALERLAESLELQQDETGERDPAYVEALVLAGQAIQLLKADYENAEEHYRRALDLQRALYPGDHPVTARILILLGRVLEVRQHLPAAADAVRHALAMSRRMYGEQHQSVAHALNALANVERLQGRFEQAEELYRESLAVRRRLVGDDHPRLASAVYNLATLLHRDLNRLEDAEVLYRQAVETFRRTAGEDHPSMGYYKMGLGRILTDLGRPQEAEPLLREVLALFHRLGPEGRGAASARSALAAALIGQGRYDEAERLLLDSLPVLRAKLGDDHRITVRALRRLVTVYESTGRPRDAETYRALLAPPSS